MPKAHSTSSASSFQDPRDDALPELDLPTGQEILEEELKNQMGSENGYDYPEIEEYTQEELQAVLDEDIGEDLKEEYAQDARLNALAEDILKERIEHPFSELMDHIDERSKKVDWNKLFGETTHTPSDISTSNEQLKAAIIERILGSAGRKYKLSYCVKLPLNEYRGNHNKSHENPLDILEALYPKLNIAGRSEIEKIDIITKLSILMIFLPLPKIDEFVEKNILLERILQGDSWSQAVHHTLEMMQPFDMKNHGFNYNYRLDQLMILFSWLDEKLLDLPDWLGQGELTDIVRREVSKRTSTGNYLDDRYLAYFKNWYQTIQTKLLEMKEHGATDEVLYAGFQVFIHALSNRNYNSSTMFDKDTFNYTQAACTLSIDKNKKLALYKFLLLKLPKMLEDHPLNLRPKSVLQRLNEGGVTYRELIDGGVTFDELRDYGCYPKDLIKEGYTVRQLYEGYEKPGRMNLGGITSLAIYEGGVSIQELIDWGVSIWAIWEGGIPIKDIENYFLEAGYPESVLRNLQAEGDIYQYVKQLHQLTKVILVEKESIKGEGNTLKIAGKIFSVLRPEVNSKDIFARMEGGDYEHITYIKRTAISREVQKAGKKLFKNITEAKNFINTHIPGTTEARRIRNFATLLGLGKSGYRNSIGGRGHQGERGYAWLTEPDEDKAGGLAFSDGEAEAGIYRGYLGHSLPVVCFKD